MCGQGSAHDRVFRRCRQVDAVRRLRPDRDAFSERGIDTPGRLRQAYGAKGSPLARMPQTSDTERLPPIIRFPQAACLHRLSVVTALRRDATPLQGATRRSVQTSDRCPGPAARAGSPATAGPIGCRYDREKMRRLRSRLARPRNSSRSSSRWEQSLLQPVLQEHQSVQLSIALEQWSLFGSEPLH